MHPSGEAQLEFTAQVTVHDFQTGTPGLTLSLSSRLQHGRAMAAAANLCVGWVTPPIVAPREFDLCHDKSLFEYMLKAPQFTTGNKWTDLASLQEWGEPFSEVTDDHFRLQDLEDFDSTDFQTLLNFTSQGAIECPDYGGKRSLDVGIVGDPPSKRPRLVTASIADFIPQPHFIAGPASKFDPVDINTITPFRKVQPSPVPPYDTSAVAQLLKSGFRRGAWLVPVRGSPPWDGATTAVILDSPRDAGTSSPPPSDLSSCSIIWTRKSLVSFWQFLVSIQQAKKLGPLSLSFHPAPTDAVVLADTASDSTWESNNLCHLQLSKPTVVSSDNFSPYLYRARLEGTDFIKIYHDVHYSLSLRNILDAYHHVPAETSGDDRKIRMLKGARLVFMDECSKAVFLL